MFAMNDYVYVNIHTLDPVELANLLNKQKVREHLVQHDQFDLSSMKEWIRDKMEMDSRQGCKVKGIVSNKVIAGWCGIQLENDKYEIAIVLDDGYWGLGRRIFRDLMGWAKDLGHKEIFIYFLDSRPEYRFLRKISVNVFKTEILGRMFTAYQLPVY